MVNNINNNNITERGDGVYHAIFYDFGKTHASILDACRTVRCAARPTAAFLETCSWGPWDTFFCGKLAFFLCYEYFVNIPT